MLQASNMTHAEFFRMNGTLSEERCLELIDLSEQVTHHEDAVTKVQEGMGQFPAEDFLEDIRSKLGDIAKRLRGDNKADLLGVLEALDDLAQCTFYASEYGRSELSDALKILEGKPDAQQNAAKQRLADSPRRARC